MKKFIVLLFGLFLCGCSVLPAAQEEGKTVGVANPASTFCIEQGGELEIRDEENGQAGYCLFADGTEREEWEFFRENNEKEKEMARPQIPEGCESWFDGCNNCMVGENGMLACTRMFCAPEMMKPAKCTKFAEEKVVEEKITCFGIAGTPCPENMECKSSNNGVVMPDAGGICVLKEVIKKSPMVDAFAPSFMPGPPLIIYKTKKDYSNLVPVGLADDGKTISHYPDMQDVVISDTDEFRTPTKLVQGYLLDNKGIWKGSAFLKVNYETYAKYSETPNTEELQKLILDDDPFLEIYDCGVRWDITIDEVNSIINSGQLNKCKS